VCQTTGLRRGQFRKPGAAARPGHALEDDPHRGVFLFDSASLTGTPIAYTNWMRTRLLGRGEGDRDAIGNYRSLEPGWPLGSAATAPNP
jgi:hypothetical protein